MVHSLQETFFLKTLNQEHKNLKTNLFIEVFDAKDEKKIYQMIKKYLQPLEAASLIFTATKRRLESLTKTYQACGSVLLVAKIKSSHQTHIVGCLGLGPLHGLEVSEKLGEIRDLVVEEDWRRGGIGSRLLYASIEAAKKIGYKTLYLETSENMLQAQKLFLRSGFRPIRETKADKTYKNEDPCYFLLENL